MYAHIDRALVFSEVLVVKLCHSGSGLGIEHKPITQQLVKSIIAIESAPASLHFNTLHRNPPTGSDMHEFRKWGAGTSLTHQQAHVDRLENKLTRNSNLLGTPA